jgi:hypothetical protein
MLNFIPLLYINLYFEKYRISVEKLNFDCFLSESEHYQKAQNQRSQKNKSGDFFEKIRRLINQSIIRPINHSSTNKKACKIADPGITYLELDVPAKAEGAPGPNDLQHLVTPVIAHGKTRGKKTFKSRSGALMLVSRGRHVV